MTKTIQPHSPIILNEPNKNLIIQKPETENYENLLLSLFNNMSDLYESLNKLNHVIEKKITELNSYCKDTGEKE